MTGTTQPTVIALIDARGRLWLWDPGLDSWRHDDGRRTLLRDLADLGMHGHADQPQGARFLTDDGNEATRLKRALDELHFRKIDLSDAIYVINVGGYVGNSTKREIAYARAHGKDVEWMFPDAIPAELEAAA